MTWSWFWEHEMNACWWVFFWSLPVNPSNFTLHKSIILSQALLTRCNYSSWCVQTVSGRLSTNEKDVLLSLEQLFFSSIIFSLTQFHLGCLLKDFYNEKKNKFLELAHWQSWYEWIKDAMASFDLLPHWRHADNFKQWNIF